MDQFDKYLKDKLENAEVPFNEQHWKEFQKSLAKQTRLKRLRKIGIAAAVTVVIATSVFMYVKNNFNETSIDEHNEQKAELVLNENNNNALKAEQVESAGEKVNKEESTENKKLVFATENTKENVQQTELTEQNIPENTENKTTENIINSSSEDNNDLTEKTQEKEAEKEESSKNSLYLKALNTLSVEVSNYNTCAGTPVQVKLINPENLPLKDIEWTFGDGHTAKGEKSTHVYKFSGEYQVLCVVNNNFEEPVKIQAKNKIVVNK
ncbi:MAG TPA: hypothetical protein DIU39_03590 [Flavobacteriales bacterium]|nr:hypothetical protein [Flavobacteriales bacterium]